MAILLSQPQPPTAVYAHSDEVALGRSALRVPEDLSVVGIDDPRMAELTGPATVRQPVWEQEGLPGRMLLSIRRDEEAEHDVVVQTQLVIQAAQHRRVLQPCLPADGWRSRTRSTAVTALAATTHVGAARWRQLPSAVRSSSRPGHPAPNLARSASWADLSHADLMLEIYFPE
ncbi:substrate-binding domain-containing protein [Streptomyces sp. NPDC048277]|uniref:substrate-binding domain-containing protein n=1 Tax=Streptomyces sp. NPDC048277 TaxID=3155027 RepID=UPI0033EE4356